MTRTIFIVATNSIVFFFRSYVLCLKLDCVWMMRCLAGFNLFLQEAQLSILSFKCINSWTSQRVEGISINAKNSFQVKALIKAKTSLRSKQKKFKLSKHKAWLNQQIFHFAQQTCLSIHLNFVVFVLDFTVCAFAARQRRSEDRNQNIISQATIGCAHKT